jgi:hypothetical protein
MATKYHPSESIGLEDVEGYLTLQQSSVRHRRHLHYLVCLPSGSRFSPHLEIVATTNVNIVAEVVTRLVSHCPWLRCVSVNSEMVWCSKSIHDVLQWRSIPMRVLPDWECRQDARVARFIAAFENDVMAHFAHARLVDIAAAAERWLTS